MVEMRIGIIGAGRIGGNVARLLAAAGHEVKLSFARDRAKLEAFAGEIGERASTGSPAEAAGFGEVVILSVPWGTIDDALAQAGSLEGKILIDTTNQFGSGPMPAEGQTAAEFNAGRMPGARYTKSFNTLTSGFQAAAAGRTGPDRVVLFLCGDDGEAKRVVAGLIEDAGFAAVDVGGIADAAVMEAPRRDGAVYGEEYRLPDAEAVVEAVRAGRPIPPTPSY
jgi:8-hydroxy-5-deazaflavin:NADPH oxidoreductase